MSSIIWNNYFPYSNPREQQTKVIKKVLEEFKNGKKYAIIECGTGVGKSAIGFTIAKALCNNMGFESEKEDSAYFLTTQKVLQEQYIKDFSCKGLKNLSSSSNYTCTRSGKNESCKDISTLLKTSDVPKRFESCKYDCIYKIKKSEFIDSKLGITNFSYFLTEKNLSGKLPNKKVLIIDEAHNLENELTKFIEITVSENFSEKILKIKVPKDLNTQFKVFNWIKKEYLNSLNSKIRYMENKINELGLKSVLSDFKKINSQYEMMLSHRSKILRFVSIYDKDNWIFDLDNSKKQRKFIFKPVDISHYSKDYLLNFADFIVFMSATIISHDGFSTTIGLPIKETVSIKEKSPFDPKNNPILFTPAGSMSFKNIDQTLPVAIKMINEIIENHKNQKGIIHTHNIKIAEAIKNKIKNKRIIVAYGENREESLKKHIKSKNPTILVSPSMSEGVDLKGKLSEFQIICKVPFPYLGDKVTKKKMNKWSWWYDTQTIRTVIQSMGRSIRSEKDEAITYILDKDWERLVNKNRNIFPPGFFDAYHQ